MTEPKKKNPLLIVLGVSFVLFVLFTITANWYMKSLISGKTDKYSSKFAAKSKNVGVLEINTAIMDSKKWLEQIEMFEEDPMIKAVIIRLNSPGGAVGPSQEVYDAVKRLNAKKPVYASMGSIAASGAFYIAMGARKIYANPGTITASIGVIMHFADASKLMQWAKVNSFVVKTGKYKDIGAFNREMTPDEKNLLQGMIDNVLEQFRRAISEGRKLPMEQVVAISDGRIMSGEQAKGLKLVDELGGVFEAAEAIAKEAGIEGKPKLVYAVKKKKFLERLLEEQDDYDLDGSTSTIGKILGLFKETKGAFSDGGSPLLMMVPKFGIE